LIKGVNELVVTTKGKADCFPFRSFFGIKVFAVQIVEISSCQNTARFEWPDDLQINHEEEEWNSLQFSNPMKQVRHGNPGIGATKSSAYVPLK
jgi:hypothetical protein